MYLLLRNNSVVNMKVKIEGTSEEILQRFIQLSDMVNSKKIVYTVANED